MHIWLVKRSQLIGGLAAFLAILSLLLFWPAWKGTGQVLPVDAPEGEGVLVPVIMYHSILNDPARAGKFVISQETLERDMLYLIEHGYTTVTINDLIAYVYDGRALPTKPVVLTFDDGYYNNMTYLLPLLEKHDMKAVISVVGEYTERFSLVDDHNPNYSHFTWEDIAQMAATGRIEIQNHSFSMHVQGARSGSRRKRGETLEQYAKALGDDLLKLQGLLTEKSGVTPTAFAYPFGLISDESMDIIKALGFKSSFTCYEHINTITADPDSLFNLGRYNRPNGIGTEKFMKKALPL